MQIKQSELQTVLAGLRLLQAAQNAVEPSEALAALQKHPALMSSAAIDALCQRLVADAGAWRGRRKGE